MTINLKYISGTPEYKERIRNKMKKYRKTQHYKNNKKYYNNKSYLKRVYGITPEQYNEMVQQQNGVCAICLNLPINGKWKKLVIDHNHITGLRRKLLCDNCNRILGFIKEDINILNNMKNYLESFLLQGNSQTPSRD